MNFSPDELRNMALAHAQEQRTLEVIRKGMKKARRSRAIPPVPMAPTIAETIPKTLLRCSHTAVALYVALCSFKTPDGIIRTNPRELGEMISRGRTAVTDATLELKSAGLLQRIGRYGYVVRRTI